MISRLFDHFTFLSWWLHRESSRYIHSTFQMCSRKQPFLSSFFKTSSPAPQKSCCKGMQHSTLAAPHLALPSKALSRVRLLLCCKKELWCDGKESFALESSENWLRHDFASSYMIWVMIGKIRVQFQAYFSIIKWLKLWRSGNSQILICLSAVAPIWRFYFAYPIGEANSIFKCTTSYYNFMTDFFTGVLWQRWEKCNFCAMCAMVTVTHV